MFSLAYKTLSAFSQQLAENILFFLSSSLPVLVIKKKYNHLI